MTLTKTNDLDLNSYSSVSNASETVAIMQPYFLPYLGYFQLLDASDLFIVYDRIEYTKKGWINRNRFLLNGEEMLFSIPLEKASDYTFISDRVISPNFVKERAKILAQIHQGYRNSSQYKQVYPILESIFLYNENNLFEFILNSITVVRDYLEIKTPIKRSSELTNCELFKGAEKVKNVAKSVGALNYVNPIGGTALYTKEDFADSGLKLMFHNIKPLPYPQHSKEFVSHLSIIDVLMNVPKEELGTHLGSYDLI